MGYKSDTPRINVKFINSVTEEELFEIKNKSWMDVGQVFCNHIASSLIETDRNEKKKPLPKKVMVLAVIELTLE
jgi:hypothetical protein